MTFIEMVEEAQQEMLLKPPPALSDRQVVTLRALLGR